MRRGRKVDQSVEKGTRREKERERKLVSFALEKKSPNSRTNPPVARKKEGKSSSAAAAVVVPLMVHSGSIRIVVVVHE